MHQSAYLSVAGNIPVCSAKVNAGPGARQENIMSESEAIISKNYVEVNYDDKIPNNVNLSGDKQWQRALESWHPDYLEWWKEAGPDGFQDADVYLRTAVGVGPSGWAVFDHVKKSD